jgi:hypothetical protein
MTAKASSPHQQRTSLVFALQEIVDALDRRVPQIERAGEMRIARDALFLRRKAVERLEELERADGGYEDGLAHAVMTDDGGAS